MPALLRRWAIVATAGVIALVALPGTAFAHGIDGSAAGKSVLEFVPLGIEHMLLGWDHLLFIAGIVLLAGDLRRAAKLITVFVIGHSTTLIVATMAGWRVDAVAVDIAIALSLVFVGIVGVIGRPTRWRWFALAVLGFGLVHGMGLATRLQDLGLPEDGVLHRVLAFNVGVEIGQLIAITAMVLLGKLLAKFLTWWRAPRLAHSGLIVAGLVTAVVLAISPPTASNMAAARDTFGDCTVHPSTRTAAGEGNHPDKSFYEPGEEVPTLNFEHILGDGSIVIEYAAALPTPQLDQLRQLITSPSGTGLFGGAVAGQPHPFQAINAYDTLACSTFDLSALTSFTTAWFADPRAHPAQ
ncbi:HupE/UreJ family protein [Pseudonocardia sp. GCM10023141]|uniref:HupE/UreJ family protein n=1 Tax=Pseudonocardia sp. GCM10023141 TaxID=3252653 RepID=UPI0036072A3B